MNTKRLKPWISASVLKIIAEVVIRCGIDTKYLAILKQLGLRLLVFNELYCLPKPILLGVLASVERLKDYSN